MASPAVTAGTPTANQHLKGVFAIKALTNSKLRLSHYCPLRSHKHHVHQKCGFRNAPVCFHVIFPRLLPTAHRGHLTFTQSVEDKFPELKLPSPAAINRSFMLLSLWLIMLLLFGWLLQKAPVFWDEVTPGNQSWGVVPRGGARRKSPLSHVWRVCWARAPWHSVSQVLP